jgi:hypothetical protein
MKSPAPLERSDTKQSLTLCNTLSKTDKTIAATIILCVAGSPSYFWYFYLCKLLGLRRVAIASMKLISKPSTLATTNTAISTHPTTMKRPSQPRLCLLWMPIVVFATPAVALSWLTHQTRLN